MEFKNADDAAYAISAVHGHPFDSKHRFSLNRFTDIERFANLDETYVDPEPEPFVQKVQPFPSNVSFILNVFIGTLASLLGRPSGT